MPSLDAKVWRPFVVGDLFEIFLPTGDTQADKCEVGNIPLISAGFNNNGVCKFIKCGDDKSKIYDGNIISVDMFGKAFFHVYKFYSVSHGRINLLKPLEKLNAHHLQFVSISINKSSREKFSYNQMCSSKRIALLPIFLPVTEDGSPDYEFMENYIRAHETKILQRYRDYIHELDAAQIQPLSEKTWREFLMSDLFRFESGKCNQANQLTKSDKGIPYIGATNRNNGVLDFVEPDEKFISRGNAIAFVCDGEGSMGFSFYKAEDCIATTNIIFGYADFLNEYVGMFITTVADKVRGKYSYNYKRRLLRLRNEKIMLPVTDGGAPDFEFMEAFTRNKFAQTVRRYLDFVEIVPPTDNSTVD